ncbi:hypothetical protein A2W24_04070 [Microgenomates group bacterium RBG_16_45_19]|nr:MAG: hypothetical protein A2W24_04070 [Microgenomates group bacterium RBG_16_45_19]
MTKFKPIYLISLLVIFASVVAVAVISLKVQQTKVPVFVPPKAAPTASFRLEPDTSQPLPTNSSIPFNLYLNFAEFAFSNATLRLAIPKNQGLTASLLVETLSPNEGWSYPYLELDSTSDPNYFFIDLSLVHTTPEGGPAGEYRIATFDLATTTATPPFNLILSQTEVYGKNNEHIIIPDQNLTYQVGVAPTFTPIPPTPTPSPNPTPTPTLTPTPIPTLTPIPTPTPTPSPTPIPPTATPVPTATPTPRAVTLTFHLQGVNRHHDLAQTAQISLYSRQANGTDAQLLGSFSPTATVPGNDGHYVVTLTPTPYLPDGHYNLTIKTDNHLRRRFNNVPLAGTGNIAFNFTTDPTFRSYELYAGDINHDNRITQYDVALVNSVYTGSFAVSVPPGTPADINMDNIVDIQDLAIALIHFQDFIVPGDN